MFGSQNSMAMKQADKVVPALEKKILKHLLKWPNKILGQDGPSKCQSQKP